MVGRTPEFVKDQIGFIAPRVIACIINEAYLALQEGVSTKDQIDLAMQLGTNYPLGPFAWADKIGKKKFLHYSRYFLKIFRVIHQPLIFAKK